MAIVANRHQALAVRREFDRVYSCAMSLEHRQFVAVRYVPDAHGGIVAGSGESLAVRRDVNVVDRALVTEEAAQQPPKENVPLAHNFVRTALEQGSPIRAERQHLARLAD